MKRPVMNEIILNIKNKFTNPIKAIKCTGL